MWPKSEVFAAPLDGPATKAYPRRLQGRLENRPPPLEQRMTIRLGGSMLVAIGVAAALAKLL